MIYLLYNILCGKHDLEYFIHQIFNLLFQEKSTDGMSLYPVGLNWSFVVKSNLLSINTNYLSSQKFLKKSRTKFPFLPSMFVCNVFNDDKPG